MVILIGVALLSAAGWLISLGYSRSAARRHLVLSMTLALCFLLPIGVGVRSGTNWTLLAIRTSPRGPNSEASAKAPPMSISSIERSVALRDAAEFRDAHSTDARPAQEISGAATIKGDYNSSSGQQNVSSSEAGVTAPGSPKPAPGSEGDATSWRTLAMRWGPIIYAAVAALRLLRLFASLAAVLRVRRRAVEIESLGGGIQVLEADIAVPVALGFGRSAIVLPRGFRETVEPRVLQDVLAHESEHLRRRDHWGLLLQGIAAAAYWPIVTVHLVNRALTRAREELCDNAVLTRRDPAEYCQTLLSVAERMVGRRSFANQLAPTIVGRGELERRVAGLLDHRRDRRTCVGPPARTMFAAGLLALGTLAATTRVVAVADAIQQGESTSGQPSSDAPAPKDNIVWTGVPKVDADHPALHRGVVLGADGKPLAGAAIYAGSTYELLKLPDEDQVGVKELGPVRAVTDAEGRFEFTATDLTSITPAGKTIRWETLLVATKKDLAPGWLKTWGDDRTFRSHWDPPLSREVAIRMRPPTTLTGRLLLEGEGALSGARVRLTGLMAPIEYDLDRHVPKEEINALGMFSGVNYAETLYRPSLIPSMKTETTTDKDGRFELSGLPEGFISQIDITHPQAVTTSMRVATRAIEPVHRKTFNGQLEPMPTLSGSGFTTSLPKGAVLRGHVIFGWPPHDNAVGVTIALANHNAPDGMTGQQFKTDAEGRFEVTGFANRPEAYELAFVGSFAAPYGSRRQRIVPGEEARVELAPAVPYRLKLTDPEGNPVDREVHSIVVQKEPGDVRRDVKSRFNNAQRVAPGVYEGIVPIGPAAVVVKRGAKTDRPAAVDPKAFFAPGRTDWTLEEERYAYGDAWRISQCPVATTESLAVAKYWTQDQLELAAVTFTNATQNSGVLELAAVTASDPPVTVTLVDEAGKPVEHARVERQMQRYDGEDLPATFSVYGLHPERAEFLSFKQEERGLIGTLSTTWTPDPVRVVMQPAARLIGRFVDKSGNLDFEFGAHVVGKGVMADTLVAGRVFNTIEVSGERKGEFQLLVPPGVEVLGTFVRKTNWVTRPSVATAFGPLTPKPGETVDLGDLTVP